MAETKIVVGPQPFSVGEEYPWLAERDEDGAVVTFTGKVRNHNLGDSVKALTAASVAALTIYDMCKAVQKDMVIGPVRLLAKSGGKSGDFKVEADD